MTFQLDYRWFPRGIMIGISSKCLKRLGAYSKLKVVGSGSCELPRLVCFNFARNHDAHGIIEEITA